MIFEKDGFDELEERAIRMGRFDILMEIIKARDCAEEEYSESLRNERGVEIIER